LHDLLEEFGIRLTEHSTWSGDPGNPFLAGFEKKGYYNVEGAECRNARYWVGNAEKVIVEARGDVAETVPGDTAEEIFHCHCRPT
jgi:hypothetical protein